MFFLKRSLLYVRRKWGKNLTVGIILFVVSTLVLIGLLIRTASNNAFEVARNKLGATVTYTTDLSSTFSSQATSGEKPTGGGGASFSIPDDYTSITTKEIEEIASTSKYVDSYTLSASMAAEAIDFSYYSPSTTTEGSDNNVPKFNSSANVNIVGVDTEDKETNFNSDEMPITEGRYFTDEEITNASNVIIIEETIAELNNIVIGDTITIQKVNDKGRMPTSNEDTSEESVDIIYEVIGIYKTSTSTDLTESGFMSTYNLSENTMYAPYTNVLSSDLAGLEGDELEAAKAEIEENGYEVKEVVFTLNDPDNIDSFIEEVNNIKNIDTTYRSISANDAAYEKMVGSIKSVASISTVLVVVVIFAGAFIIGLLSMLSIKDRKYELGVLLALGESRIKIILQLIREMIIVAVIAFSLATGASNVMAQATTNFLLNQEINSESTESTTQEFGRGGNFGGNMRTPGSTDLASIDVETIDTLTISVNFIDVLEMFGIGLLIIIVGNVIQASFVLRCNPKEILLER